MSPTDCLALRVPELGVAILCRLSGPRGDLAEPTELRHLDGRRDRWLVSLRGAGDYFDIWRRQRSPPGARESEGPARQGWTWLEAQGYLVDDPSQTSGNWKRLTPEGEAIANDPDAGVALRRAKAASQLDVDLHPRLAAAGVQQTFRAGETDNAIRASFACLEGTVRTLSELTGARGVNL